ncbi:GHKL domain-containing protein [Aeribacillus sp. FSL K6-8394]|uniref:sensor histidine kinase n=1 Tax=Aeribacillus sp. FSL K6-8394 TaxID=2954570 RepID=UPI0030F80DEB
MSTLAVLFLQFAITVMSLKIISNIKRFNLMDVIIVLVMSLMTMILTGIIGSYASVILFPFTCCLSYYYHKELINSLFYGSYTLLVVLVSDHISYYIDTISFGSIPDLTDIQILFHFTVYSVSGILLSLIVRKLFQYIVNHQLITFMAFIGFSTVFIYYGLIFGLNSTGETGKFIGLSLLFFLIYLSISIITFIIYAIHLKKQFNLQKKVKEFESLMKYTSEIEKQYQNMRKFRHDYQNILLSIEIFISEKDLEGLKKYYEEVLKPTSKFLYENNFKLGNLSKIKIKELKSIFASKLMLAQELGINARFEANTYIFELPIDSYTLITSVGILLDNAIEELIHIKNGELSTGIIKDGNCFSIIVQNSCRSNIPKIHLLKEPGFSTKGKGRGLGLSNLHELLSPLKNVTTETTIRDNLFTQIIYIYMED